MRIEYSEIPGSNAEIGFSYTKSAFTIYTQRNRLGGSTEL